MYVKNYIKDSPNKSIKKFDFEKKVIPQNM